LFKVSFLFDRNKRGGGIKEFRWKNGIRNEITTNDQKEMDTGTFGEIEKCRISKKRFSGVSMKNRVLEEIEFHLEFTIEIGLFKSSHLLLLHLFKQWEEERRLSRKR
jgi:hypothetical protein